MSNNFMHEIVLEGIESNLMTLDMPQQDEIGETLNIIIINDTNTMIMWANYP